MRQRHEAESYVRQLSRCLSHRSASQKGVEQQTPWSISLMYSSINSALFFTFPGSFLKWIMDSVFHVSIHVNCPLGTVDAESRPSTFHSFADWGYFHCHTVEYLGVELDSSWNNGLWTVSVPRGSCHLLGRDWHAWFLFSNISDRAENRWWVLQTGGDCRETERGTEIANVTASPRLSNSTILSFITFSVAFCLCRNEPERRSPVTRARGSANLHGIRTHACAKTMVNLPTVTTLCHLQFH